jgi:hypothetical protein
VAPGSTGFTVLRWSLTVDTSGRRFRRLRLILRGSLQLSSLPQRVDWVLSLTGQFSLDLSVPLSIYPSKSAIQAWANAAAGANQGRPSPQGSLVDPCAGAAFAAGCPNVISAIATQEIVFRIL